MKFKGEIRNMTSLRERIRIASGEGKADLLIKNGRIVDVFSGQIEKRDVAIFGGLIVGFFENFTAGFLSSKFKDLITFVLLLVVLRLRPQGLLGRGGR